MSEIVNIVKKSIRPNIIEKNIFCATCDKETTFIVNFNNDFIICSECNSTNRIPDTFYSEIYAQLKKLFGNNIIITSKLRK